MIILGLIVFVADFIFRMLFYIISFPSYISKYSFTTEKLEKYTHRK